MNILITGGLGHIGSHFIDSINKIKKINQVYIIDDNSNNRINWILFVLDEKNFSRRLFHENVLTICVVKILFT